MDNLFVLYTYVVCQQNGDLFLTKLQKKKQTWKG